VKELFMKMKYCVMCAGFAALFLGLPLYGQDEDASPEPSASASASKGDASTDDAAPTDEVVRKLAAMTADQTFKREAPTVSKGGPAPEGTTVFPVKINDAGGKLLFDATFFKDPKDGKWAIVDSAGNVMHSTD
jgi:hypothetical protein